MKLKVSEIRKIIKGLPGERVIETTDTGFMLLATDAKAPAHRRIDLVKAVEFKTSGRSYAEIGKIFGVSRQAVQHFFQEHGLVAPAAE